MYSCLTGGLALSYKMQAYTISNLNMCKQLQVKVKEKGHKKVQETVAILQPTEA